MPELIDEVQYSDLPLSFTPHPVTKNIKLLTDADAVKRSVRNIVLTNFYEKPYAPAFGGDLISQLFELMDSITEYNISTNIRSALTLSEPRAIIDDVITEANQDGNAVNVTVKFRISGRSEPLTITVLLERVR
jgi:phage baseplate assembly protein W